ncbi:restriction endonuclease subunit S [Mycobacterium syngnathidarum]
MRKYRDYIDSGEPSMVSIPTHWRVLRVKNIGRAIIGLTYDPGDVVDDSSQGTLVLRAGNIQEGRLNFDDNVYVKKSVPPDLRLRCGDIVVCARNGSAHLIGKNAVATSEVAGHTWGAFMAVLRSGHNDYLRWVLNSRIFAAQTGLYSTSTINQLTSGTLHNLRFAMPPPREQRAVADFLDRETAQIDSLIEEQKQLVELLRERRQSLVALTLLRGRAEGVELRASGDSRLGDIPAHWRLVPTRYLCTITTGSEDSGNATDDGEYPFYVRGREILRIGRYSFDGEAVMTPGDGQGGTGKVFHYFDGKFEAHQRVYVFKDFHGVLGRYFYLYLSTFLRPVALAGSNTVTMESLRRPVLADFVVALPSIDEQAEIVAYLDEQTSKIDTLIAETQRFIELARERRSALITAAVTGQIDVRGEVA